MGNWEKSKIWLGIGIIAIASVMGLGFVACEEDKDSGDELIGVESNMTGDKLTVSGTFGGATVDGVQCFARLRVKFEWDELEYIFYTDKKSGSWSVDHFPFEKEQPLWFEVSILVEGTDAPNDLDTKIINYQYDIKRPIKDKNISNITLPAISFNTITVSGNVSTELAGDWELDYMESVIITNNNLAIDIEKNLGKGWKDASCYAAKDGTWKVKVPSSNSNVTFGVGLTHFYYLDLLYPADNWTQGRINKLNPIKLNNSNISDIDLGNQKFVLLSGDTPVKVNGKHPFLYRIEFGLYWNELGDFNGWSGATLYLFGSDKKSSWAVPMPANIDLQAVVMYYEDSRDQFRGEKWLETFYTGSTAKNMDYYLGSLNF